MSQGSLKINGTSITIIHGSGSKTPGITEAFEVLKARAIEKLPEKYRGDMTQYTQIQSTGAVSLNFGSSYFPSRGNMSAQEYTELKDKITAKKFMVVGKILEELILADINPGYFSPRDSYPKPVLDGNNKPIVTNGRAERTYQPACQIFFNKEIRQIAPTQEQVPPEQAFINSFDDPIEGATKLLELKEKFKDETILNMVLKSFVKKQAPAVAPTPETENSSEACDSSEACNSSEELDEMPF